MQYKTKIELAIFVGFPILVGLVLGANQTRAGAFLPWHLSIAYWLIISVMTWWTLGVATWVALSVFRPWSPPKWSVWLLGGILGSFVARYVIYVTASAFHPFMTNADLRAMPEVVFDLAFVRYYATNWSAILGMWVAACWSKEILIARAPAVSSGASINFIVPDVTTSPRPDVGFFTRLPSQIGKDVVALHSEDHYLRVFTKLGEALILARLSDAIELCAASGISGTRIHRSWWVSNQSVIKSISLGRKVSLILHGDIEAPVSQSYKAAARQSGLLTDQHNN